MKLDKNKKILIVGLGLIGGSYAYALKEKGYEVGAITLNKEDIDYALKHDIISHGQTEVTKEYVSKFDVVIFALYPKVLLEWINEHKDYFKNGAVLTDVTGVKQEIVYKIENTLNGNVEFIGAHPMAGKEVYGVQNAKKDLFKGANYIVTPTKSSSEEAIELAKSIGEELEFGKISILSPEEHDEMIAFLSQLTHCIAVALMTCKESQHLKDYTGDSFRDLTRIANINENMWSELFLMNKNELLSQMDLFIKEFSKLRNSLENEDLETMKDMMKLSTYRRSFFNKK
jgi:prephenate dehydrogenase